MSKRLRFIIKREFQHHVFNEINNMANVEVVPGTDSVLIEPKEGYNFVDIITVINDKVNLLKSTKSTPFDDINIKTLSRAQIETYIDNNITDLASAKAFLKILASIVLYLAKREANEL